MEPLQTWWATELYPSKDEDTFGVAGDFEVVRAADAQATIAALQARVQELEAIKIPDDAFTYCAYCGEKSPVDEHNEDLSAHIKVCPKHPMRDVESHLTQRTTELHETQNHLADADNEVEQLRKQLSERTAELEAIETILDIDSGKTTVDKVRDLHRAFKQVWESYQDASNEMFKAQAELERVRGELAEMRERKDGAYLERNCVVAALATCFPSGVARTAIEGWDEEWHGCVYIDLPVGQVSWHYHDSHAHLFAHLPPYTKPWDGHTTEEKYKRVALLQHRQGMEG